MSQSAASAEQTPFHLTGNFAPISEEFTHLKLDVTGEL